MKTNLLPQNPSFAGHQTFALRSGWLKKGFDAVRDEGDDIFSRPDALAVLGVGKNMVTSIRHYLLATGVAREARAGGRSTGIYLTDFGHAVFADTGLDPYLEFPATLFLLHWRLAGPGTPLYTWSFTFNFFRPVEFSRESLTDALLRSLNGLTRPPSQETAARDVDCLLHTYLAPSVVSGASSNSGNDLDSLDSPLRSLGLIGPTFERSYRITVGSRPGLSPAVFMYALVEYWQKLRPEERTLPLRDIVFKEGSPGTVFKLAEEDVYGLLEEVTELTGGQLRLDDTSQTRQIICEGTIAQIPISPLLTACYAC